ncbi:GlxA family transcriptional regulator [Amycolatopsis minnesotensis]|uniref:Helix-turn-helix domain-containing protein n=1 Tax=Amycolatopsis minnesotensis TaxID=337894 RepID=A0ABN2Q2V9_9PSEU
MNRLHRVAAVVVPPQSTFELGCVAEVFGIEHPGVETRYAFEVCGEARGAVPTKAGYEMVIPRGLDALEEADSIFVTGWPDRGAPPSPELRTALTAAHARGARVAGICSGAFALAATGLLDGRAATTHWRMADELARRYPDVLVRPQALYVDHGDVATSAGTGAAIDLALELVRRDFGAAYAADIARQMVLPPHREGGQRQYARVTPARPAPLSAVIEWAEANLHRPVSVDDLAATGAVSTRTLTRLFERELGTTPGKWLLRRRLREACALLERTDATIEGVAAAAGFGDVSNFRRRFADEYGTPPSTYRRTFAARPR